MSAIIHVQVEGASEIVSALREELPDLIDSYVAEAIQTVGSRMADDARRFVPVRTGFLLSTIGLGSTGLKWSFWLYARAPYAAWVEWGTRRMAPRLFMTRALELHAQEMRQEINDAVARAFTDAGLTLIG